MFDTAATIRGIRLAKFRDKLGLALKCQYDLLEKAIQGRTFSLVTMERAVTDSGRIEELPFYRQLKRWWWKTGEGRYAIVLRYGYHRLPFEPARFVYEADQLADLKPLSRRCVASIKASSIGPLMAICHRVELPASRTSRRSTSASDKA
jgi:hypothetical protein